MHNAYVSFSISFSESVSGALIFLMFYPLSATYYQALIKHKLPDNQQTILMLLSTVIGVFGLTTAIRLFSQMQEACILDLISFAVTPFILKLILKKGPDFFDRHFFKNYPPA